MTPSTRRDHEDTKNTKKHEEGNFVVAFRRVECAIVRRTVMERPQSIGRRQLLRMLSGGGTGVAALGTMGAARTGLATMMASAPNPLEAAQAATSRGLPRLKITDIKVIRTQVG
jgi:hypothetical protein